jgi:hypothetical protein
VKYPYAPPAARISKIIMMIIIIITFDFFFGVGDILSTSATGGTLIFGSAPSWVGGVPAGASVLAEGVGVGSLGVDAAGVDDSVAAAG